MASGTAHHDGKGGIRWPPSLLSLMHLTQAHITIYTSGQGVMKCVHEPAQNEVAISTGLVPLCTTPLHPGVMRKPLPCTQRYPGACCAHLYLTNGCSRLWKSREAHRVTWWRPNCQRPSVSHSGQSAGKVMAPEMPGIDP